MRPWKLLPLALIGMAPVEALAGPYSDSLARCLVDSTSVKDRQVFVTWMFAGFSKHPAVRGYVDMDQAYIVSLDREVAHIMENLLVEDCPVETSEALRYEGEFAMEQAFKVLGEVAGMELTTDPDVGASLMGFTYYLDMARLEAAFGPLQ